MSNESLEQVLKAARMLPPDDRKKLRESLEEGAPEAPGDNFRGAGKLPNKSYELEYTWLREHGADYAGQWVALDGDRLVSHGVDVRCVHEAATAAGVELPYLIQVEPEDALPFGGW